MFPKFGHRTHKSQKFVKPNMKRNVTHIIEPICLALIIALTLLNELFIAALQDEDLSMIRRFSGNDSGSDLKAKRREIIDKTLARTQGNK